jgi:hypothetical protein
VTIRTYRATYVTCDEPGCNRQTGSTCTDHGEKGPALAHWDTWSVDGKHFCDKHVKDETT